MKFQILFLAMLPITFAADCICPQVKCPENELALCQCLNSAALACYEKCGGSIPNLKICPKPITALRRSSLNPCSIRSFSCPGRETCRAKPPCQNLGEGCPGICVRDNIPSCAGLLGLLGRQCPQGLGLRCFDTPDDGCDPQKDGAECRGICLPF